MLRTGRSCRVSGLPFRASSRDDTEPFLLIPHWPELITWPRPIAGWRGVMRTPVPRTGWADVSHHHSRCILVALPEEPGGISYDAVLTGVHCPSSFPVQLFSFPLNPVYVLGAHSSASYYSSVFFPILFHLWLECMQFYEYFF